MTNKICSAPNCDKKVLAHGFCRLHYDRFHRHGDISDPPKTKHGKYGTPVYKVWTSMLYRCNTPTCSSYKDYGGRGITVCERWHEFKNFYADMGDRPSSLHQLDRKDNNGNYEPSNCRWVLAKENIRNRRNGRLTEITAKRIKEAIQNGFTQEQIGKQFGVAASTVGAIRQGRLWKDV